MKDVRRRSKNHRMYILLLISFMILHASSFAQLDTVYVSSDVVGSGGGNLNTAVNAKIKAGTLSKTVFKLEPYGYYMLNDTIIVPTQQQLTIVADEPGSIQETAPPQILWSSSVSGTTNINFQCYGSITLKNVQLLNATTAGVQTGTSLQIEDDSVANAKGTGEVAEFEGVIFDWSGCPQDGSGAVDVKAKHFRGTFKNCYWRNCIDDHYRYYGRAVSYHYSTLGYHSDSLVFENCTFANMGYVLMQEADEYADYIRFNHCTFLNIMSYALEYGRWRNLAVTNSIFVNSSLLGRECGPNSYTDREINGSVNIDSVSSFGFTVPFTDVDRHILFSYSSYSTDQWLCDWYADDQNPIYQTWLSGMLNTDRIKPAMMLDSITKVFFDTVANGTKLYPYMNRAYLYDSTDPRFVIPPTNTVALKRFLYFKWATGGGDTSWAYNILDDIALTWPMGENLAYTNDTLLHAGMGGYPLGDLYHWFSEQYTSWKAQSALENLKIANYLATGVDTVTTNIKGQSGTVLHYELSQNYPNPFNPMTTMSYHLPVASKVVLKIYDVLGREIATLVNAVEQRGEHFACWNAATDASGVYFCKLSANDFTMTRKIILLK